MSKSETIKFRKFLCFTDLKEKIADVCYKIFMDEGYDKFL